MHILEALRLVDAARNEFMALGADHESRMQAPRVLQKLLDWKARLTTAKAIAGQSSDMSQTDIEAKIAVDQSTV